jgi:hypothetical protein
MLIFQTDAIIDRFKLDKGFAETNIASNLHRSTILSISVIVIGGLLVVNEIPDLCRSLFNYWQERKLSRGVYRPTASNIVVGGVKIILGLL